MAPQFIHTSGAGLHGDTRLRGPGVTVPPTLVFALGLLAAWSMHRRLVSLPILAAGPAPAQVVVGWLLVSAGMGLFAWGLGTFARARTGIMLQDPALRLVREGPYRWSRNPQYVGFTAVYLGVALIINSAWALLFLPAVLVLLTATVIAREERYMRDRFGPTYEDYCRRVRRWL